MQIVVKLFSGAFWMNQRQDDMVVKDMHEPYTLIELELSPDFATSYEPLRRQTLNLSFSSIK